MFDLCNIIEQQTFSIQTLFTVLFLPILMVKLTVNDSRLLLRTKINKTITKTEEIKWFWKQSIHGLQEK